MAGIVIATRQAVSLNGFFFKGIIKDKRMNKMWWNNSCCDTLNKSILNIAEELWDSATISDRMFDIRPMFHCDVTDLLKVEKYGDKNEENG